ncbi:hypothetical protein [Nitrosomonas sp.]|uniref:hypothetical protein n=1 Tax=Nitrosomonas sp. TaxID=42353 RepID=UPI0025E8DE92|nr:hypothetical protein [Nitrosomonas sp.]
MYTAPGSNMYLLIVMVTSIFLVAGVVMPNTRVALSDLIVILYLSYLIKTLFFRSVDSQEKKTSDREEESSKK